MLPREEESFGLRPIEACGVGRFLEVLLVRQDDVSQRTDPAFVVALRRWDVARPLRRNRLEGEGLLSLCPSVKSAMPICALAVAFLSDKCAILIASSLSDKSAILLVQSMSAAISDKCAIFEASAASKSVSRRIVDLDDVFHL